MRTKRSRSCNDHGELSQDKKRPRRAASDTQLETKNVLSSLDSALILPENDSDGDKAGQNNERNVLVNDRFDEDTHETYAQGENPSCASETHSAPVSSWVEGLPMAPTGFDDMSQASFKRPRSSSDVSVRSSDNTSSIEVRGNRTDMYKDPRYDALIESKGAFMRNSEAGPLPDEIEYCKELLSSQADGGLAEMELRDPVFDSKFLQLYVDLMQRSSELRLCIDLHARLVPSAEILSLREGKIGDLREGCNDRWLQAVPFLSKLPQPDRTVGFRASLFTDLERQKLGIQPGAGSLFTACEGMLFPFFTCEVKAGSEGLATARRANANSMAVALRGVVTLFRRAKMEQDIHRKIVVITIAHNASTVELYCHFPEINGLNTTYYQYRLRAFDYGDRDGQDRYTSYAFVHNVYSKFSKRHLKRLKEALTKLDVPLLPDVPINLEREVNPLTPSSSGPEVLSVDSATPAGRGLSQKAQLAKLTQDVTTMQREMERQRQEYQERIQEAKKREDEAKEREVEARRREDMLMKLLSERSNPSQDGTVKQ